MYHSNLGQVLFTTTALKKLCYSTIHYLSKPNFQTPIISTKFVQQLSITPYTATKKSIATPLYSAATIDKPTDRIIEIITQQAHIILSHLQNSDKKKYTISPDFFKKYAQLIQDSCTINSRYTLSNMDLKATDNSPYDHLLGELLIKTHQTLSDTAAIVVERYIHHSLAQKKEPLLIKEALFFALMLIPHYTQLLNSPLFKIIEGQAYLNLHKECFEVFLPNAGPLAQAQQLYIDYRRQDVHSIRLTDYPKK